MKGLTLTQARNIEVLTHLEDACKHEHQGAFPGSAIHVDMRRENVEEFCETIREVLG